MSTEQGTGKYRHMHPCVARAGSGVTCSAAACWPSARWLAALLEWVTVVEGGKLVGVISRADVVRALAHYEFGTR